MKALLINPGHDGSHFKHESHRRVHRDPPPMSIMSVGSFFYRSGAEIDILDTHVEEDWKRKLEELLRRNKYNWVGITVLIGKFMANADEITKLIRQLSPKTTVVWGGVMCSVMPEEIKRVYQPDVVWSGGVRDQPIIHWPLLGDKFNESQIPYYHMVMSSVGCPYNCTFCYKHSISEGGGLRYRSVEDICQEMDTMNMLTGTRVFTFGDDNFLTGRVRSIKILEYCKAHGYYIEECIGHINNLTDDLIQAMKGTVQTFIFSIETVSGKLQTLLNKSIQLGTVADKLVKLRNAGKIGRAHV